jgi:hypothetical protein
MGNLIEGFREIKQNHTSLQQWEETWQMQFHPQKCNVIHVANKCKPITHSYKLHDPILEVMENSKYLPHLHHFRYVCTTDSRLRRVEHQM